MFRLAYAFFAVTDGISRKVATRGVEARLYAAMAAGVMLPLGCVLYAFTITPSVHWVVPSIGVIIIIGEISGI